MLSSINVLAKWFTLSLVHRVVIVLFGFMSNLSSVHIVVFIATSLSVILVDCFLMSYTSWIGLQFSSSGQYNDDLFLYMIRYSSRVH